MDELIDMDLEIDFEFYKAYFLFYKEKIDFNNPNFKVNMNNMIHLLNELGFYRDKYLVNYEKDGILYNQRLNRICYHMSSKFKKLTEEEKNTLDNIDVSYSSLDEKLVSKLGDILINVSNKNEIDKYDLMLDISQKLMSNDKETVIKLLLEEIGINKYENLDSIKEQIKDYPESILKNHVKSSQEFHDKCNKYGFDFLNFNIVDNYVVVRTFHENLYVIMNNDYDIINITKLGQTNLEKQVENSFNELSMYNLDYPFETLNLDDIIIIGNSDISTTCDLEDQILSYIKFLSIEARSYQDKTLALQSVGLDVPPVTKYLCLVKNSMEEYIKCRRSINIPTTKNDVLEFLGQKEEKIEDKDIKKIIDFIENSHDDILVKENIEKLKSKSKKIKIKSK